ncbi:NUDIX domain-containing protein [Martelella radicis]|uniref:GDP-mannose pyrophosphatase n=1 Tax=Martelella radicis TaxID=1397476 RepID=A0A7W6P9D2_9HYPH|nr:NUDIX domain-containing protein [Martelella radicis]MBB4121690.1 nudix-type nucleoside diphosphatase (YffH/AdpP family) [Martelella radicis]
MTRDQSAPISNLSRTTLSDGWCRLVEYAFDYHFADGRVVERSWEVCERPEATSVLVFDRSSRKFVLVRQFRVPVYAMGEGDGFFLETAAGLIDDGESPEETAIREVCEETGYHVEELLPIRAIIAAPGLMTEKIHCYAAIVDEGMRIGAGGGLDEEHEEIQVVHLAFDEAMAMVDSGEISDAKTIVMLQWAALNRDVFGL